MLITNNPKLAVLAENCGVRRIFVDLEKIGKRERQGHLDTFISNHTIADVSAVKSKLTKAELLVRLNPLHQGTELEVDEAIAGGADLLMLPMFSYAEEVYQFSEIVKGRARVVPLIETYLAAQQISKIVAIPEVSEIYLGLNDLHLDMKKTFMFELLADGFIDSLAQEIRKANKPFGFGGVARVGEGVIPGELVLAEHLRLHSTSVILSRTFNRPGNDFDFKKEVQKLQAAIGGLNKRGIEQINSDKEKLKRMVAQYLQG